ncbi:MAG: hypothetical protein CMQ79_02715 [Gammaproteobacteria bacterium]|nr:hypothetical protein [Gammaproteobacteria bacterium]
MKCRPGCGACCIAPSIRTPMPGMPNGKPAGVPCIHLTDGLACRLFSSPQRPAFCASFKAEISVCGASRKEALSSIKLLERASG